MIKILDRLSWIGLIVVALIELVIIGKTIAEGLL